MTFHKDIHNKQVIYLQGHKFCQVEVFTIKKYNQTNLNLRIMIMYYKVNCNNLF